MKKWHFWTLGFSLILCFTGFGFAQEDIDQHPSCIHCGMDRLEYSHSRMLIEYQDGTSVGLCSIYCAAVELESNNGKTPGNILVADYNSKALINAKEAFWVIGGSKKGVMTQTAKWAFESKKDAEAFIEENGGELTNFDNALKIAKEEFTAKRKR